MRKMEGRAAVADFLTSAWESFSLTKVVSRGRGASEVLMRKIRTTWITMWQHPIYGWMKHCSSA
jgi:hypothetical protein